MTRQLRRLLELWPIGFGATVFESAPGNDSIHIPVLGDVGFDPDSHSDYFKPNTPSLLSMAEIMTSTGTVE